MQNLFLPGICYLNQGNGVLGVILHLEQKWVHTKSKYRSSSAPPNHFSRERNLRGKMFTDALGRDRIRWPRSGALNVCLHPCMFHNSTSTMHVNNLKKNFATHCPGGKQKSCHHNLPWGPRSTEFWSAVVRFEPRHFNPHFICPRTQPSQSHRTQLGPSI